MTDNRRDLLSRILADESLRQALVECCARDLLHAEGRRITYRPRNLKGPLITVTPVLARKYETIPADDWRDLFLVEDDGQLRLEGSRKWLSPEPGYEPRGWAFVRFDENHLLEFPAKFSAQPAVLAPTPLPATSNGETALAPNARNRRAGAKPRKQLTVAAFVSKKYPNGIPSDVTYSTICDDFAQSEGGWRISERTLRRALGKR